MEIEGKVIKKLAPVTGEGRNGTWKKQSFVIETQAEYPKKICFTVWSDRVNFNDFTESDMVKVFFDIESREYKENWYTDLTCWRVNVIKYNASEMPKEESEPTINNSNDFLLEDDPGDDLPF